MKEWEQLEQYICEELKEIDPYIKRTPGSGNGSKKGDIYFSSNCGLHIEAKQRNKKNVWDIDWLTKCAEEIPLHSKKTPIVVSENRDGKKIVHLDAEDFFELYKDYWRMKNE